MGAWLRRLSQLYVGLCLYGASAAMQVQAGLGLDPWDVLHQGIANRVHLAIGTVSIIVGAVVLLGWLPIRQIPGLGTVSNVVVVGLSLNVTLGFLPVQHGLLARYALLLGGIVLCGLATGMYITAGLGPGPRDGLMTGWSQKLGTSIRLTRTAIELSVLAVGWLLGGTVGVGTVLFAVAIGPIAQMFLRLFGASYGRTSIAAGAAIAARCVPETMSTSWTSRSTSTKIETSKRPAPPLGEVEIPAFDGSSVVAEST
ncbi:membrane protein YczE [Jatrophihabitans sp. DSM 45814]